MPPLHGPDAPSDWVRRWAHRVRPRGRVLDVACGGGRHLRYFAGLGCEVVGVDRDPAARDAAAGLPGASVVIADIESGPWPFEPGAFDAVVVTNYLHRPLFPRLTEALRADGVMLYETFAAGNERYGRPANPEFLLQPDELLERVKPLRVVAFEQGTVERPRPAVVQRICAVRGSGASTRLDGG